MKKPTLDAVAYDADEDDTDEHIGLWISGLSEGDLDDYTKTGMPISVREIRFTDGATEFIGQNLPSMNTKYLTLPASVEYMHNEAFYYPFTAKVIDFDETMTGSKSDGQTALNKRLKSMGLMKELCLTLAAEQERLLKCLLIRAMT